MKEKLLTIKQTAEIFNKHWKTVYFWVRDGKIQATQIGRAWYVSSAEVNYIKKNGLREEKGE